RWLYETAEIMHRDISLNNLMFRVKAGRVCGVLNDFDLSAVLDASSPSTSKQCTGTKPYMALDLLVLGLPPSHLWRFDLESLFYVLLFLTCHYHEGMVIENPPLTRWEHIGTEVFCDAKTAFFLRKCPEPTPSLLPLHSWTVRLHAMFADGYGARARAARMVNTLSDESDSESDPIPLFYPDTLGDHVTFDKFEAIFNRELKLK
ncbi:hypothetical protein C8R44DRAFT_623746, partial [Mycena epipterygia]